MKYYNIFFLILFLLLNINSLQAQSSDQSATESSFSKDYMKEIDAAKDKLLALAEAIPQDKFGWRPGEGVRSVSEVFMHVFGANYFILTYVGGKLPEGFNRDMETKVTDKAEVTKYLKDSYNNLANVISTLDEKTLDDPVEFFGTKSTKRHLLFILMDHNHEHLGQLIAYSRMNGITPPWSMKQQ